MDMEVGMVMKVLLSMCCVGACSLALYLYYTVWVVPQRLLAGFRRQDIGGPRPSFPYGNIADMREAVAAAKSARRAGGRIVHDYRPAVLPFYEKWRKEHALMLLGFRIFGLSCCCMTLLDSKQRYIPYEY